MGNFICDLKMRSNLIYNSNSFSFLVKSFFSEGFRSVLIFRLSNFFYKFHLTIISYILTEINCILQRVKIGVGTKIGPGFVIAQSNGVVISNKSIIGNNVFVEHQVTIGGRYPRTMKYPKIGNNVFIGCGAKILGNVKIGDNAKIGANAVVINDVPENSTAVGIPAKIVRKRISKK